MKHFGKHGVLFALAAMTIEALWFAGSGVPQYGVARTVDTTIGVCLFLALAIWALQNATRR